MLFLVGGQLQVRHYPKVIEDDDWKDIAGLADIPVEAEQVRHAIDDYIGYCRELEVDAVDKCGDDWFDALGPAMKAEQISKGQLDAIMANRKRHPSEETISPVGFFEALAMGLDGQEKIPTQELDKITKRLKLIFKQKQRLIQWYAGAQHRLHYFQRTAEKTGRTSLYALVQLLNGLLHSYRGQFISPSAKVNSFKYALKVCLIAKPNLVEPRRGKQPKPGLIDPQQERKRERKLQERAKATLARVIKEVRGIEEGRAEPSTAETYITESWEHLMPDWLPARRLYLRKSGVHVCLQRSGRLFNVNVRPGVKVMFPRVPFIPKAIARRQSKIKMPAGNDTSSDKDVHVDAARQGASPTMDSRQPLQSWQHAGENLEAEIFFVAQAVGSALEDANFIVEAFDEAE